MRTCRSGEPFRINAVVSPKRGGAVHRILTCAIPLGSPREPATDFVRTTQVGLKRKRSTVSLTDRRPAAGPRVPLRLVIVGGVESCAKATTDARKRACLRLIISRRAEAALSDMRWRQQPFFLLHAPAVNAFGATLRNLRQKKPRDGHVSHTQKTRTHKLVA